MGIHLPEPLRLPWQLKPVCSASAGVETLNDGRKKLWIDVAPENWTILECEFSRTRLVTEAGFAEVTC